MGRFDDALRLAALTGTSVDMSAVRHMRSRFGVSFNLEQQISNVVSIFAKGGVADGAIEPYEFNDVDRTIASGVTVRGNSRHRQDDRLGIAAVINAIGRVHQKFLNAGGLGILVGDGRLPRPGTEQIVESYDVAVAKILHVAVDAPLVRHPSYNQDRGPVPVGAVRVHAQF